MSAARSASAMILLHRAVETVGPLFMVEQVQSAASPMNLTSQRVRGLLSQLAQVGWIELIKQGSYVARAPLFSMSIHPYAVAAALVSPHSPSATGQRWPTTA